MKIKWCINRSGCCIGNFEDACIELNECRFDTVGMIETCLRDDVQKDGNKYMIGKGRKKHVVSVALYRKEKNLNVDEIVQLGRISLY